MEDEPPGRCCRFLRRLGLFVLFLLLAPLFLVFATPVALVACTCNLFGEGCGCWWLACLLFPVTFAIGLALDVITIPLMIIAFVVLVSIHIVTMCRSRYENKRRAAARIEEIIERNRRLILDGGDGEGSPDTYGSEGGGRYDS